ncbi:MAG: hypothetical protein Q4G61_10080 [Tissierellia bacterium]|nr:hypothetical protein [Tissierellia bacterium]
MNEKSVISTIERFYLYLVQLLLSSNLSIFETKQIGDQYETVYLVGTDIWYENKWLFLLILLLGFTEYMGLRRGGHWPKISFVVVIATTLITFMPFVFRFPHLVNMQLLGFFLTAGFLWGIPALMTIALYWRQLKLNVGGGL